MYFVYLVSFANLKVYEDMTYICVYLFFKNSKQEAIAQRTQTFMPRGDCPAQKRAKEFFFRYLMSIQEEASQIRNIAKAISTFIIFVSFTVYDNPMSKNTVFFWTILPLLSSVHTWINICKRNIPRIQQIYVLMMKMIFFHIVMNTNTLVLFLHHY